MSDGTAPATQHVLLAAAGLKHSLRIGKDRADLKVPDGIPLKITAGTSFIEFDGKGGITIDAHDGDDQGEDQGRDDRARRSTPRRPAR